MGGNLYLVGTINGEFRFTASYICANLELCPFLFDGNQEDKVTYPI